MRRLIAVAVACTSLGLVLGFYLRGGPPAALAGGVVEPCAAKNGDVNANGKIDLSDPVMVLGFLFQGSPTELVPLCETPAKPCGLPATGQTNCYGDLEGQWVENPCGSAACSGQDGSYQAGCPSEGRFFDNGDGTVTDHCTGLMWQKDTGNDASPLNWCGALSYCEILSFGGHDDWRLPNVRELQSIVDYGRFNPTIDPVFGALSCPDPRPCGDSFYWSSTSSADEFSPGGAAWGVVFGTGDVNGAYKEVSGSVRAVRNAP